MQSWKVDDFSGGFTDHYLSGPVNRGFRYSNLLITRNKKITTRPGSELDDETNYRIPAGQQRISKVFALSSQVFKQSARNLYYVASGIYSTLVGPVSSNPVFGAGTTASHVAQAEWQKHALLTIDTYSTPRMVYKDSGNTWRVHNAGLPAIASNPTIALSSGSDSLSYIHAFVMKFTYTVGTRTFVMRGPPVLVQTIDQTATAITSGTPASISAIPVLANGATECYDTASIKIEIYRTQNDAIDLYYVGEVTNGTTTFSDQVEDSALAAAGVTIYTTGGVYDFDPPPQSKFVIVVDGVAWWLNCKEGSEEHPQRIRQGLKDRMYAAPAELYLDCDEDITGGGYIDIYPIIFERSQAWRVEGFLSQTGTGVSRKRRIVGTSGAVSHNGIVKIPEGLVYPGVDGFYFTDGFKSFKISNHLDGSYKLRTATTTQEKRIQGARDPVSGRVYWSMQSADTATDADEIWVFDPYFGIKEESTFTTLTGEDDFYATALAWIGKKLYRADRIGHTFTHDDDLLTDPVISTTLDGDEWETRAVRYDYVSCAFSMGTEESKKFAPKITLVAKNETNVSLLVQSVNNDAGVDDAKNMKEIRFRSNIVWGDEDIIWGDPNVIWNYRGAIVQERWFPAGSHNFLYKQVRFSNSYTILVRSDDLGLATFDNVAKTVVLDDAPPAIWGGGLVGMTIHQETDDYAIGYEITAATDDTLTYTDTLDQSESGAMKWLVMGYRKNERLTLESYTIDWEMFGESTQGYQKGEDGQNA